MILGCSCILTVDPGVMRFLEKERYFRKVADFWTVDGQPLTLKYIDVPQMSRLLSSIDHTFMEHTVLFITKYNILL